MYLSPEKLASTFQSICYKPFGRCENGPFRISKKEFELLASKRDLSISNEKFCTSFLKKLKGMELMLTPHEDCYVISEAKTAGHIANNTVRHIAKPDMSASSQSKRVVPQHRFSLFDFALCFQGIIREAT